MAATDPGADAAAADACAGALTSLTASLRGQGRPPGSW
jgi:hypothetical protein